MLKKDFLREAPGGFSEEEKKKKATGGEAVEGNPSGF